MERWLPVVGYEDLYHVSDLGRVKALERVSPYRGGFRTYTERVLSPAMVGGSLKVCLCKHGRKSMRGVGSLVLEAHVGPRPAGAITRHWPERDPMNCALTNLSWSTQSQNCFDRRAHGTDAMLNRTHCPSGHEYTPENTKRKKNGARECRICTNRANREYRARKRAVA